MMEWFQCSPYKYFLLFLFLMLCLENVRSDNNVCPKYCVCYMWTTSAVLRRADCINQRLVNIDADVPQHVQALDLSNNSIFQLNNYEFKNLGLMKLKYVNMKFNKISSIGLHAFSELKYLQVVDLSHNHLHLLKPKTFLDTPVLSALLLSHNKLGTIVSGPLLEVPSLKELDISHCQLGMTQSELFSKLPSLKRLILSSNQLTRVDPSVLRPLKMLSDVDLSDNPLSCDGITTQLQEWLLTQHLKDTTTCTKQEQKFAKIITAVNVTAEIERMDDDITKYWFEIAEDRDELEDDDSRVVKKNTTAAYFNPVQYLDVLEKIPSVWAMLIGFEVGVVISVFGMYMWLGGPKMPKVNLRRPSSGHNEVMWRELRTEMPICPETPPPPYQYRSTLNL